MGKPCNTILGKLWQAELTGATDSSQVHSKFMKCIGDYITANVTANVTFVGALISPPNTPLTVLDIVSIDGTPTSIHKVKFDIPSKDKNGCYTDGGKEWLAWLKSVYEGIAKAYFIGPLSVPVTSPTPAFTPMVAPSFSRDDLLKAYQGNEDDPQWAVFDALALGIMKDMQQFFTATFAAVYSVSYAGVCTVNTITTP